MRSSAMVLLLSIYTVPVHLPSYSTSWGIGCLVCGHKFPAQLVDATVTRKLLFVPTRGFVTVRVRHKKRPSLRSPTRNSFHPHPLKFNVGFGMLRIWVAIKNDHLCSLARRRKANIELEGVGVDAFRGR